MKKIIMLGLFLFLTAGIANTSYGLPEIFEIFVDSSVSGSGSSWDYLYTLYYDPYEPSTHKMKSISHWWLEINCASSSIPRESIFGWSIDEEYEWTMWFEQNSGKVGGYADWVIKWEDPPPQLTEEVVDIEPNASGYRLIGSFGFHSTQPPTTGNWGAKDGDIGGTLAFDDGQTQIPVSFDPACETYIPEPATMLLFGIGMLGFGVFKRRKR